SFENGWNIGVTNIPEQIIRNCSSGHHGTLQDCLPMNNLLWGFAVGSYALGGLIGSLLAGHFQAHYGRRNTLIFNTLNWIFGGLLLGIAVHPMMFVVGRVLTGVGSGTGSVVVSTYLGEIATVKSRGALGTTNQLFIVIGILASQLFGL
ncbi:10933_t:CDS:2, partial [Acaulospora morrowiae]